MSSYRDYIIPRFYLEIGGRPADDLFPFINSFEYKDNEKKADELTLSFSNKGLRWQDDDRFKKGVKIKTRWGYPGRLSSIREMKVVGLSLAMPTEPPSIRMQAYDVRFDMKKKNVLSRSNAATHQFKSSSEIAAGIAKSYGLKMNIADSKDARKEYRVQAAGTTDMEFLTGLASKLNWDLYVEEGTLHFHPKQLNAAPSHEYLYYVDATGTLMDFQVDLSAHKKGKKGKTSVNPQTGQVTAASPLTPADSKPKTESTVGQAMIQMSVGSIQYDNSSLFGPTPETNPSVVNAHAEAEHDKDAMNAVKANITVVGTPSIKSKGMVKVLGVGKRYSGPWRITEVTHTIVSSGQVYTTKCDLKKAVTGKKEAANTTGQTEPGAKEKRVTIYMRRGAAEYER